MPSRLVPASDPLPGGGLDGEADPVATPEDWSAAAAALHAGRWADAAASYAALASETADPRAQEGLAQVGWWLDDADTALDAREAAYRGFRALGDDRGAARAAASLGYDSVLFGKGVAVGRGWLSLAEDLLGQRADVPEAGWLAVRQAEVALNVDHDATAALRRATQAEEVGQATAEGELVIVGRALAGLARVRLGDVDAGMSQLDAAVAAATAGDVDDVMWMGKICCWLINACHETHDLGRAADWCQRVEEICERRDLEPLFVVCRTQYASVLLAGGQPRRAESTLVDVLARLEGSRRASRLDAVTQLGELRRRQGRLVESEELLQKAGFRADAVTSLARLRLDAGDADRAWSIIAELLRAVAPEQLLERVDALTVAVAAGVAAGHEDDAREAAAELRIIASRVRTPAFQAFTDAAEARLAGAEGVGRWQDAVRGFHIAGLAFDEADARRDLAAVLRACGDGAAALGEGGRGTGPARAAPGAVDTGRCRTAHRAPVTGAPAHRPRVQQCRDRGAAAPE